MTVAFRNSSTQLQRLRIEVLMMQNECEQNEKLFTENLAKYIQLIWFLQGDIYNHEEAKEHYYNMLTYCNANKEFLYKSFSTITGNINNFQELKSFGKRFQYVDKDDDLEEIENKLMELEII
jgi:hypothetical protein